MLSSVTINSSAAMNRSMKNNRMAEIEGKMAEVIGILQKESGFRKTLLERASKRVLDVREDGQKHWTVEGKEKMGDEYGSYGVKLNGNKYFCECFKHFYGETRQGRLCSHILAVIIWRRLQ